MSDFLASPIPGAPAESVAIVIRLVIAMLLGALVAFIYRRTRYAHETTPSFTVTLVLLTILIAMVTQVIGDNVARAFSLVGALSIVRFRTVVRDTQDTAYVIFAVAVGMAVGAAHPWLAIASIGVVGFAAYVMRERRTGGATTVNDDPYVVQVRVGVGHDPALLLKATLDEFLGGHRLQSIETARQGLALDVAYRGTLRDDARAGELVKALNRVEGVQSVTIQRQETAAE